MKNSFKLSKLSVNQNSKTNDDIVFQVIIISCTMCFIFYIFFLDFEISFKVGSQKLSFSIVVRFIDLAKGYLF